MATASVNQLIRNARADGYHVHYLQPTPIAAVCARMLGNRIRAIPVLRKD